MILVQSFSSDFVKYPGDLEHSVTKFTITGEGLGWCSRGILLYYSAKSPWGTKSPSSLALQAGRSQHFLSLTGTWTVQKSGLLWTIPFLKYVKENIALLVNDSPPPPQGPSLRSGLLFQSSSHWGRETCPQLTPANIFLFFYYKCFISISSVNPSYRPMGQIPLYRGVNQGPEMLTRLPEITQLGAGRADSLLFAASGHQSSLRTFHEGSSLTSVPGQNFFLKCLECRWKSGVSVQRLGLTGSHWERCVTLKWANISLLL